MKIFKIVTKCREGMQTPTWLKYSTKSDNKQEFISSLLTQRTSVQQVQTDTFNFLLSLQQYL